MTAVRTLAALVKQATGEAKWDAYLAECQASGRPPMTRREYERRRAQHREENPQARCC